MKLKIAKFLFGIIAPTLNKAGIYLKPNSKLERADFLEWALEQSKQYEWNLFLVFYYRNNEVLVLQRPSVKSAWCDRSWKSLIEYKNPTKS